MNGMHLRRQHRAPSRRFWAIFLERMEQRSDHWLPSVYIYIYHLALMFRWHAKDEARDEIGIGIGIRAKTVTGSQLHATHITKRS